MARRKRVQPKKKDKRGTILFIALLLAIISGIATYTIYLVLQDTKLVYKQKLSKDNMDNFVSELEKVENDIRYITNEYSNAEKTGLLDRYKDMYAQLHGKAFEGDDPVEYEGENNLTEKHKRRWQNARDLVLGEGLTSYYNALMKKYENQREVKNQKNILIKELNKDIQKHAQTLKVEREVHSKEIAKERNRLEELKENKKNLRKDFREKSTQLSLIKTGLGKRLDEIKHAGESIRTVEELNKLTKEELVAEAEKEGIENIEVFDKSDLVKKIFQKRQIDGKVLSANMDRRIVVVNRGSADGVEPNQTFEVFSLEQGIVKRPKGSIKIKKVEDQISYAQVVTLNDPLHPIIDGDCIGHIEYKKGEAKAFVLTGNFTQKYNRRELDLIIKGGGGRIEDRIGVGTDYLVVGEAPGELPPEKTIERIVELYLYNDKSLEYIQKEFRLKPELANYTTMLFSARELGIRIFNESKLLEFLKWQEKETFELKEMADTASVNE